MFRHLAIAFAADLDRDVLSSGTDLKIWGEDSGAWISGRLFVRVRAVKDTTGL